MQPHRRQHLLARIVVESDHHLALGQSHGRLVRDDNELFAEAGWLRVLQGQGIAAGGDHPLDDLLSEDEVAAFLAQIGGVVKTCVDVMPAHRAFIAAIVAGGAGKK